MRALAVVALAICACGSDAGGVLVVTVDSAGHVPAVASFRVVATTSGHSSMPIAIPLAHGPADIPPAQTFALAFDASRNGAVHVSVDALGSDGASIASGTNDGTITPGQETMATVLLGGVVVGDMGGDGASSDATMPQDMPRLDLTTPDLAMPTDLSRPDLAIPDLATPDLAMPPDLSGVVTPTPPSCVALPKACGPNADTDCCGSPVVPGGMFFRSYDAAGDASSGNQNYPATVSTFRLDRYEVTVGRFKQFIAAVNNGWRPTTGMGANPKIANSGWNYFGSGWPFDAANLTANLMNMTYCTRGGYPTLADNSGASDNRPINCLTWYEAFAFCAWDGGRLPTEAEWGYAAQGGDEQRAYPWSNPYGSTEIDASEAGFNCPTGCISTADSDIGHVGSKSPSGDGRWGQADLSGNVYEWILDRYIAPFQIDPCNDCAYLDVSMASDPVLLGGSYNYGPPNSRLAFRFHYSDAGRFPFYGVRCARSP